MEYFNLGNLKLSRIAFGCEPLGGTDWGAVDPALVEQAILGAVDRGVSFFDTAAVYGLGMSEERLGRILSSRARNLVISTKIGLHWSSEQSNGRAHVYVDNSRRGLLSSLEASLARLRMDGVPLAFIHRHDSKVSPHELAQTITEIQQRGLAGAVGLSNFSLEQVQEVENLIPIPIVQILFSAAANSPEQQQYLAYAKQRGIHVCTYGVLHRGLLSGKYNSNSVFAADDRRSRLPDFKGEELAQRLQVLDCITEVAREVGANVAQVAIRWALDCPGLSAAILGIKTLQQMEDNIGALGVCLSAEQHSRISTATCF